MNRLESRQMGSGPTVAQVSMTVVETRAVVYSIVRCPDCDRRIMDVPGEPLIQTRTVTADSASGRGRVVNCKRCNAFVEVIEHR